MYNGVDCDVKCGGELTAGKFKGGQSIWKLISRFVTIIGTYVI